MKHDPTIKNAIDESLGSVRFTQQDTYAVLYAVREKRAPQRKSARKRRARYAWPAAAVMLLLVIAPLGLLIARSLRSGMTDIATITAVGPGESDHGEAFDPVQPTPVPKAQTALIAEGDAIRAARTCFEAQCDTSIFTFEEYTVGASLAESGTAYIISMKSIYDNGCAFSVVVSGADGAIVSHSAPEQATIPALIRRDSAEVQAWYDRYGKHSFMWPLDIQAEFSRRYAGAAQRMPQNGETGEAAILAAACQELEASGAADAAVYASLHDGKGFADGRARYQVYGFAGGTNGGTLPESCVILSYFADNGALESTLTVFTDALQ